MTLRVVSKIEKSILVEIEQTRGIVGYRCRLCAGRQSPDFPHQTARKRSYTFPTVEI